MPLVVYRLVRNTRPPKTTSGRSALAGRPPSALETPGLTPSSGTSRPFTRKIQRAFKMPNTRQ